MATPAGVELFSIERMIRVVHPAASALAKMGSQRWARSPSDNGMQTDDCARLEDALELTAQVAAGKAA